VRCRHRICEENGIKIGDLISISIGDVTKIPAPEKVTGILSSGGPEDNAVIVPLSSAQILADKPGQYRRLYVSALTKPLDEFGRRDPSTLAPADYDRWYCTPYISSIALQIKQVLPGADVRVIRRVAEGEGAILTRVRDSALAGDICVIAGGSAGGRRLFSGVGD